MNAKILQAYIESATKEDLSGPDHSLNAKCCEAINSKLDLYASLKIDPRKQLAF